VKTGGKKKEKGQAAVAIYFILPKGEKGDALYSLRRGPRGVGDQGRRRNPGRIGGLKKGGGKGGKTPFFPIPLFALEKKKKEKSFQGVPPLFSGGGEGKGR